MVGIWESTYLYSEATANRTHSQISKEETLNPIKQDTKKGKLRYVRNCFPHKGYLWNYGAFPQVRRQPIAPVIPLYSLISTSMS